MRRDTCGQWVRVIVYVMLLLSAAITVLLGDSLWSAWRAGYVPIWAPLLAPGAFTAFVAVYGMDRWLLVRRHRYPMPRAFFQVALGVVFLTLLLPQQAWELRQLKRGDAALKEPALQLLNHPDANVRAAVCGMLTEQRPSQVPEEVYAQVEKLTYQDHASAVRQACQQAWDRWRHVSVMGREELSPVPD